MNCFLLMNSDIKTSKMRRPAMDEFQYLEKLGTEELVNIIEEMLDYEEVTFSM